ncbi:MAG: hypothetical protein ACP5J5_05295 [Dissulfurimicrobium sp.]|uniref:hypothetical protein n=1 Tax=Dissulfurimicrobium hydrothermale TaxID=1750598 RepID=UPI001EDAF51D|nr:hypothetical protein [Dissulfurimicrobium hydrothermale]UKL14296.1 hypothetical protein LGS26_03390 [Dissulfurimicrobium hydrothermale]
MKKHTVTIALAVLAFAIPPTSMVSAMEHGRQGPTSSSMPMTGQMDHGQHMMDMGTKAYETVVDGVKAIFKVIDMRERMKGMGMVMPEGIKDTHHVMVAFKDAKTGKPITEGEVRMKIVGPDKAEQVKDLMGMGDHFGADFDLSKKGRYGVMCKFKLKDGKVREAKFWYEVK